MRNLLVSILAIAISTAAQQPDTVEVSFPNSGATAAQADFLAGLAQLHNFEYEDAAAHFRKAAQIDPSFAMALWGEAMTFNHPVWHQQDLNGAREVLARLRRITTASARERLYIDSLETLFGEGTLTDRNRRYADAMAALHGRYPDDVDAAAFHALAELGTAPEGRDFTTYMRAAAILEEVFPAHPRHPGVVHYLIHCYDDPVHAPLGIRPARIYANIAPNAGHAQHMTSHIFLALGLWDDTARANENAVAVANRSRAATKRGPRACGHYNFWLQYSYLQQGRVADARRILEGCKREAEAAASVPGGEFELDPDNTSAGSYAQMRANFLIDTQLWKDEAASWAAPPNANPAARFTFDYATALAALKATSKAAPALVGRVEADRQLIEAQLTGRHPAGVEALARARLGILTRQLQGLNLAARGETGDAINLLTTTAREERSMPLEFGPPFVDKPSDELLGELLQDQMKPAEAAAAFRLALERAPGRRLSMEGLARAGRR